MSLHELREAISADWRTDAKCKDADPSLFFPEPGATGIEAKELCAACPVREQCLTEGLRVDLEGIWGGMNRRDRRALAVKLGIRTESFPTDRDITSRRCMQPRCRKKVTNKWCQFHAEQLRGLVA